MGFTKINQQYSDPVLNLAMDTLERGKQALIFVNTRQSAEKAAEEISKKIKLKKNDGLVGQILSAVGTPTRQCKRLGECVQKGIAFHHSGLVAKQRDLIEDNFRSGSISIICCTPTLAAGVDLPAFRAIIRDLKRYGGRWGMQPIPVMEYHQMAGRAGRPQFDTFGEAIVLAKTAGEKEEIVEKYVKGESEDVISKLAVEPVLRTYLLSLISAKFIQTKAEIMTFFGKTFWAFQYQDMQRMEEIIDRMLHLLIEWEFLHETGSDFQSAHEMETVKYKATALGKRVAELYIDPYTAHSLVLGMRKATQVPPEDFTVLQLVCQCLELKPLLQVRTKEWESVQERIACYEPRLLVKEPSLYDTDYDEFLASMKTALFMLDWMNEKDEEFLMENYDIRPGEIRVKLDTGDWLLYSAIELGKLLEFSEVVKFFTKVRVRLEYGVREELLKLLKLKGIGRVRARKLFTQGIKDIAGVQQCELGKLILILGRETAYSIKEQVGEKVPEEIRKTKRKGQMSMEKY